MRQTYCPYPKLYSRPEGLIHDTKYNYIDHSQKTGGELAPSPLELLAVTRERAGEEATFMVRWYCKSWLSVAGWVSWLQGSSGPTGFWLFCGVASCCCKTKHTITSPVSKDHLQTCESSNRIERPKIDWGERQPFSQHASHCPQEEVELSNTNLLITQIKVWNLTVCRKHHRGMNWVSIKRRIPNILTLLRCARELQEGLWN